MDKVSFAYLAAQLQTHLGTTLTRWQIGDIETVIDDAFERATENVKQPPNHEIASAIKKIVTASISERKIEAIKEFRAITGFGLKEAKDAIEEAIADGRYISSVGAARMTLGGQVAP